MALGHKTGGRRKGSRNKRTAEVLAAAEASGITPITYMLSVMRDPAADDKRRDAMAMAAAPYLHSKLSAIDAKLSPVAAELGREEPAITVTFVVPERDDEGRRVPLTDVVRSCDVN